MTIPDFKFIKIYWNGTRIKGGLPIQNLNDNLAIVK